MEKFNITISALQAAISTGVLLAGICIAYGRVMGVFKEKFNSIDGKFESIGSRLIRMEDYFDTIVKNNLGPANSPRQLNDKGANLLYESKMNEFVDANKDILLKMAKDKNFSNPYDAENGLIDIIRDFIEGDPKLLDGVKDSAFNTGHIPESIYFVASIYLRNMIFRDIGFNIEDIDKHSPTA